MSLNVSAPVLWDGEGNFLDGALVGIQANAIVVGYVQKPSGPSIPNQPLPGSTTVQCLQVKDRRLGTLYLTWTLEQWQAFTNISATCQVPNGLVAMKETFSATIQWVDNPATLGIEYANQEIPALPTGAGTFVPTGTNSVEITGLDSDTTYYFYIRTDCVNGSFSGWSVIQYTTAAD